MGRAEPGSAGGRLSGGAAHGTWCAGSRPFTIRPSRCGICSRKNCILGAVKRPSCHKRLPSGDLPSGRRVSRRPKKTGIIKGFCLAFPRDRGYNNSNNGVEWGGKSPRHAACRRVVFRQADYGRWSSFEFRKDSVALGNLQTSARQRGLPVSPPAGPTTSPFFYARRRFDPARVLALRSIRRGRVTGRGPGRSRFGFAARRTHRSRSPAMSRGPGGRPG